MEYKPKELRKDLITKRCIEHEMTMDEAAKQIGILRLLCQGLKTQKFLTLKHWLKFVHG